MKYILVIVLVFSLMLCAQEQKKFDDGPLSKYEEQGKTVFRFTNANEPATLDISLATGIYERRIINLLFEGLMRSGDEGKYSELAIAKDYKTKDKGKTYIFSLRKNAKWSDGKPITAHDFVASYQRTLDPKRGSPYAFVLYDIVNAEEIYYGKITDLGSLGAKALDDHTLEIKLKQVVPYFIDLLTHYIFYPIPRHAIEKYGDLWTSAKNIVGNGGFILKERTKYISMVFDRNPYYWDKDKVQLDRVIAYTTYNQVTQRRMFQSGLVDWISSPISQSAYPEVQRNEEWLVSPYLGTFFLCFNTTKKPFDDVRVRKALSLVINRKLITDKVIFGANPAYHYVPKGIANYSSLYKIKEDIVEAKKLLKEAGYPNGEGFPSVTLLYNTNASHRKIGVIAYHLWKRHLNISVKLENNEWKTYLNRLTEVNYDIIRRGWIADYNDAFSFMELFMSGNQNNHSGWGNAEYDRLVLKTKTETDVQKRMVLFQKAENILLKEGPIMPIYFYNADQMIKPYIRGFYPRIQNGDHGQKDIDTGKFNVEDHHPITRIRIDMEAKKKYYGVGIDKKSYEK